MVQAQPHNSLIVQYNCWYVAELAARYPDRLAQYDECFWRAHQYRFASPSIVLPFVQEGSSQLTDHAIHTVVNQSTVPK